MTKEEEVTMTKTVAAKSLLRPDNCAMIFIDHQGQTVFGVESMDRQELINNVIGLAKAAKLFHVPTVLTTVAAGTFTGPILTEIQELFPELKAIDRSGINAFEQEDFVAAVEATGRKKIVMSGLWTSICVSNPALSALEDGYEVYVVADCSGDATQVAHDMAMQRMIQAGVRPTTWFQVIHELQRDFSRQETYDGFMDIMMQHGGAYGQGIRYAEAMVESYGSKPSTARGRSSGGSRS